MTSLVLDTSVAAAWYLPETFSAAARIWQERLLSAGVRLVAPTLHLWELANVLRTRARSGTLDPELAREIYRLHLMAPVEIADPDPAAVLDTALGYETTAYDAVFIALALERDEPLITAESPTTPWVERLGDRVVTLARKD